MASGTFQLETLNFITLVMSISVTLVVKGFSFLAAHFDSVRCNDSAEIINHSYHYSAPLTT